MKVSEGDPVIVDLFADLGAGAASHDDPESGLPPAPEEPHVSAPASDDAATPADVTIVNFSDTTEIATEVSDQPKYTAFWRRYLSAVRQAEKGIEAVIADSEALFTDRLGHEFDGSRQLRDTRERIVALIIRKASVSFAPRTTGLTIDEYEAKESTKEHIHAATDDDFDPDVLWTYLEDHYGGDKGVETGNRQLAAKLVSQFSLKRSPPVRVKNRLELRQFIQTEKSFCGKYHKMSYYSSTAFREVCLALADFCLWAGDGDTFTRLRSFAASLYRSDEKVVSRERHDFGGIGCVMFLTAVVWEVYGELREQLQAFISMYGRDAMMSGN